MKNIIASIVREKISLWTEKAITVFLTDKLLTKEGDYIGWDATVAEATQSKELCNLGFRIKTFLFRGEPRIRGWYAPRGAKIYSVNSPKSEVRYYLIRMKDGCEFMVRLIGGIRRGRPKEEWLSKGSVQMVKKIPKCVIDGLETEVLSEFERIFEPWLMRRKFP